MLEELRQYWLVTLCKAGESIPHTVAVSEHPATWLAKYGNSHGAHNTRWHLTYSLPITKDQYLELFEAGYC